MRDICGSSVSAPFRSRRVAGVLAVLGRRWARVSMPVRVVRALTAGFVVLALLVFPAGPAAAQDHRAFGWGTNGYWQLGDGSSTANRTTPTAMPGLTGVTVRALSAGGPLAGGDVVRGFGLALLDNGTVQAWGSNANGELGDGTTINRATPGNVAGLTGVVAISSGGPHSLALQSDGTVRAWGLNSSGELGDNTFIERHSPVPVGLTNVVAVAAGSAHSLALRSNGTVWAWGANGSGQLGDTTTINRPFPVPVQGLDGVRVIAIAAGGLHSLALLSDGTVRAWGLNSSGELGSGAAGLPSTSPVPVTELDNVKAIAAGGNHSLALLADGTLRAWGLNSFGQLGNPAPNNNSPLPVQVQGLTTTVTTIAAGSRHSLAITRDGDVLAWGNNQFGELGDGTTTNHTIPAPAVTQNSFTRLIAAPVLGFFSYAA